jgi:D-sedoheptulose 7-phosphate isomerase
MKFISKYIDSLNSVNKSLNLKEIEDFVKAIKNLKNRKGRLFILGVGGSAGNASHAVNDFRKLCEIETYSPMDNISEISARTNDEGFNTIFDEYLKVSKLNKNDGILIFSVGGGNLKKKVSVNLINAIKFAKKKKSTILSILGRNDGYAALNSNHSIIITPKNEKLLTPISESYQSVIWHLIVSHPQIQKNKTKW